MAAETFVDTSGFYAVLVKRDDQHEKASDLMRKAAEQRARFITTDYVLDETATLLKARGHTHLLKTFFDGAVQSAACRVEWTDSDRFIETMSFFLKYADHGWSFTDCLSFRVMKSLRLQQALTKDSHFQEAGFSALLKA
ncbi:MAG: type II toxin-antitoxin system VapC family toxin [Gammaproteobacteria bacterium]